MGKQEVYTTLETGVDLNFSEKANLHMHRKGAKCLQNRKSRGTTCILLHYF